MTDFVLEDFLPYQLSVLSARVSRQFSELYVSRYGLSVPEWRVIAHLSQTSDPVSVREIHQRVDMDKSKISRAASRLEHRGLVVKSVSKSDRRLIELQLSGTGRQIVDELAPLAHRFEREYLERLGDQGIDFRQAVRKLLGAPDT